jgi:hypothetical protein
MKPYSLKAWLQDVALSVAVIFILAFILCQALDSGAML